MTRVAYLQFLCQVASSVYMHEDVCVITNSHTLNLIGVLHLQLHCCIILILFHFFCFMCNGEDLCRMFLLMRPLESFLHLQPPP